MGFLDRLLGRTPTEQTSSSPSGGVTRATCARRRPRPDRRESEEERAVARYRYLLRTAPPEQLEALHAEAFAKLTPEQRQQLLRELATASPGEAGTSAEPADLARAATRAEMRQPGTLQNTFSRGSVGGGMGMGGMFAGSMMGTIAGVVVGSAVANMLFDGYDQSPEAQEAGDTGGDAGPTRATAAPTPVTRAPATPAPATPVGTPASRPTPRAPTPAATGAVVAATGAAVAATSVVATSGAATSAGSEPTARRQTW